MIKKTIYAVFTINGRVSDWFMTSEEAEAKKRDLEEESFNAHYEENFDINEATLVLEESTPLTPLEQYEAEEREQREIDKMEEKFRSETR